MKTNTGFFEREANALSRVSPFDEPPEVRAERARILAEAEARVEAVRQEEAAARRLPVDRALDLLRTWSDFPRFVAATGDGQFRWVELAEKIQNERRRLGIDGQ